MTVHLMRDLENLKRSVLGLGALVEEAVDKAVIALISRRPELAEEVAQGDGKIDAEELRIEEECLKTLALHQPVANDLRFIVSLMKVGNVLEQMGDKAVSIARNARYFSGQDLGAAPLDFQKMAELARGQVGRCLDALVKQDAALAREVCAKDSEIDDMRRGARGALEESMIRDPSLIPHALRAITVARHLERIADLAAAVAEDVVFMVEGERIRHRF